MIRVFHLPVGLSYSTPWCAVVEWGIGGEKDKRGDKLYGYSIEARTPDEAVEEAWKHKPRWLPENKRTK